MKKLAFFLFSWLGLNACFCQKLSVAFDYYLFCDEQLHPYLDFSFFVYGNTLSYKEIEQNQFQGEIDIKLRFEKDGKIIDSNQFILASPIYTNNVLSSKEDFGHQFVIFKPNGEYIVHFSIQDMNNPSSSISYNEKLSILFPQDSVSISDIILLQNITPKKKNDFYNKYNLNLPLLFNNFIPKEQKTFYFFTEVNNTEQIIGKGQEFLLKTSITNVDAPELPLYEFRIIKVYPATAVQSIAQQFDIQNLSSGNYFFNVQVIDMQQNMLASKSVFFQRSNPQVANDTLAEKDYVLHHSFVAGIDSLSLLQEYVNMLYPIATEGQNIFIEKNIKKLSLNELKRFFYSFWKTIDPNRPDLAWKKYKVQLDYVQEHFGNKRGVKGYRTDRGRIYLKYGPPNSIRESPYSPDLHPYEVWHYYSIGSENNIKFVFYNIDLVTKDYALLHSTKLGETYEPAWQRMLLKGYHAVSDFEQKKPEAHWGNDMDDLWDNP